jgi:hypothetical protein
MRALAGGPIEEWAIDHGDAQRRRTLNRIPGANHQASEGLENPDPANCALVIAALI